VFFSSLLIPIAVRFFPQASVHGQSAPSLDHQGKADPDGEKVVLESLSFLLTEPVHEEAVLEMIEDHANAQACTDAESPKARQEASHKEQGTKGLHHHQAGCRPGGKAHGSECLEGLLYALAAEPPEDLLGSMGEHDHPQGNPDKKLGWAVIRFQEYSEHTSHPPLSYENPENLAEKAPSRRLHATFNLSYNN
jgi:hypothetical protein